MVKVAHFEDHSGTKYFIHIQWNLGEEEGPC
jgi:hypothetical protein